LGDDDAPSYPDDRSVSFQYNINDAMAEQSQVRLDLDRSLSLLRDHGRDQRAMSRPG
jgi:hypothetical protein